MDSPLVVEENWSLKALISLEIQWIEDAKELLLFLTIFLQSNS